MLNEQVKRKIKRIRALVLDVDGVMTDGKIIYDSRGLEVKNFDVKDGYGLVLFKRMGYKTAIITAKHTIALSARAKSLRFDKVYQDAYPKLEYYHRLLKDLSIGEKEVCYMGDDLPDLEILRRAGFSVGVKDAVAEVRKNVDYITKSKGGSGAVREVVELILKTQGKWKQILRNYL